MEAKTYKWANSAHRPAGIPADLAASELARVRAECGALTPEAVVADAEREDAPLHAAFEWDDSVAGHKYRLHQARSMIRAVVTVKADRMPEHRTFVLVKVDPSQARATYMPAIEVAYESDLLGDAISRLRSEVQSANQSLKEVVSLADAVNAAEQRRKGLKDASVHMDAAIEAVSSV